MEGRDHQVWLHGGCFLQNPPDSLQHADLESCQRSQLKRQARAEGSFEGAVFAFLGGGRVVVSMFFGRGNL